VSVFIDRDFRHLLNLYCCRGNKRARKQTVKRLERIVEFVRRPPAQIGRKQIAEFFEAKHYAASTARDYETAIRLLWDLLKRQGQPPRFADACNKKPSDGADSVNRSPTTVRQRWSPPAGSPGSDGHSVGSS
jgi:hypothetical protein